VPLDLSRREFELLLYLAQHAGQVVTRRDLLTHVWRLPYGGADKTVDVPHLVAAQEAWRGPRSSPGICTRFRGVGIKLSPPAPARGPAGGRRGGADRAGMRLRIVALVVATTSLVLVSFLVPLALVLRTLAADRAVSTATVELRPWLRWSPRSARAASGWPWHRSTPQAAPRSRSSFRNGTTAGQPALVTASVRLRAARKSFSTSTPGGVEVLVAMAGLPAGTRGDPLVRPPMRCCATALPGHGCCCSPSGLSCCCSALPWPISSPGRWSAQLTALAHAADRLAGGELSARAIVHRDHGVPAPRATALTGSRFASTTCSRVSGRASPISRIGCARR